MSVCDQIGPGSVDQTYYQGRHCGENWGDERKPIFIQQGENIHTTHHPNTRNMIVLDFNPVITVTMIVSLIVYCRIVRYKLSARGERSAPKSSRDACVCEHSADRRPGSCSPSGRGGERNKGHGSSSQRESSEGPV